MMDCSKGYRQTCRVWLDGDTDESRCRLATVWYVRSDVQRTVVGGRCGL